jgi:preprotein translocase subunit SecE
MAEKVADKAVSKDPAKPRVSPAQFVREVRAETLKVTWPSRKETMITTAMVFVMVAAASLFFLTVDWILSHAVTTVIDLLTGGS